MNSNQLASFLPDNALEFVYKWISSAKLKIKIRNPRKTKLGDYRFDPHSQMHEISINNNLSKEAFFFVLTHEIAHMHVRIQHSNAVKSHGSEWKTCFGKLLRESLMVYEAESRKIIFQHAQNPKASLGADLNLSRAFFHKEVEIDKQVQHLKEFQKFRIGKRIFIKGQKRKIRYLCKEIRTGRLYTVSGSAVVDEIITE